jgi:hypothetical protein
MQKRYMRPAGTNYLLYSSYNSAFWACGSTDRSTIAYGPHCDVSRVQITDDGTTINTAAVINGSQTWSGTGTFRSTSATDASALTTFTVSAECGPVISYSSNVGSLTEMTVAMGLCDVNGANKAVQKTWSGLLGQRKCWFTMSVSSIASPLSSSGIYVYFDVTCTGYWFIDDITLEGNKTSPDQFLAARGAAVSNSTDTKAMAVVKTCPRCKEKLLLESEQFGRPTVETEPNIPMYHQEV